MDMANINQRACLCRRRSEKVLRYLLSLFVAFNNHVFFEQVHAVGVYMALVEFSLNRLLEAAFSIVHLFKRFLDRLFPWGGLSLI